MKYFIQEQEVNKKEFDQKFEEALLKYKPLSEFFPQNEDEVREALTKARQFSFYIGNKCKTFVAIEEEICEMAQIIALTEFDSKISNAIPSALALYDEGYRKQNKEDIK